MLCWLQKPIITVPRNIVSSLLFLYKAPKICPHLVVHGAHRPDLLLHGVRLRHQNVVLVPHHADGAAGVQNQDLEFGINVIAF